MRQEIKEPKLLSSGDARKLLGISYQAIEKLVDSGKLPFFSTSSGKIFRESDVLVIQSEREAKAKTDKRVKL